jgi:NADH:ubiquinone oxidoreductase subunit B-like Fe-S oxidoreductase
MKKPYISFISLRHREKTSNNTSIPPYTTGASCCGIQLISTIESFHTSTFETVVRGGMVHSEIAFFFSLKGKGRNIA